MQPVPPGAIEVSYSDVWLPEKTLRAFAPFAGAMRAGNRLLLDAEWLRVYSGMDEVLVFRRTDPALGFIAPFGGERGSPE